MNLKNQFLNLIQKTSTTLPKDIKDFFLQPVFKENAIFEIFRKTLSLSRKKNVPICQDTGFPYFVIELPVKEAHLKPKIEKAVYLALLEATQKGILRPNTVDPISNKNYGTNLGPDLPYIDWEIKNKGFVQAKLLLKGGGSENASGQYSLPLSEIQAGRDKEGIVKTVLFHLQKIQGQGCSPGIIGIGIGGDRSLSMKTAKKQLFRKINDFHSDPEIALLEKEILDKANQLEIGPMGLGGTPTLMSAKIEKITRHPASFFVSIAYLCWVARRGECRINIK
ncbi:MAG TPA: fumarate hydratase [Spirochaetia bacterium]|nr:MAG: hypothetical protein A2Y41_12510 [Spirochaetes bacterium GWB1_36_13]HCL57708.1 fumarate hydratase [Spirochaetia bacterium]